MPAKKKCPDCGECVAIDPAGRYRPHGLNPLTRRYCAASSRPAVGGQREREATARREAATERG